MDKQTDTQNVNSTERESSKEQLESMIRNMKLQYSAHKWAEHDWIAVLIKEPQLADKCDKWNEFESNDWADLLSIQPQFADKCDKWNKFDSYDWTELLIRQPQFADKCDKWNKFDSNKWVRLLKEQPHFADKCDKWNEFEGNNWADLLSIQPQFADKCDWSKLKGYEWAWLLKEQPQFADKCDKWNYIYGDAWTYLLMEQPQFADKCIWRRLDFHNIEKLLSRQPQLADKCDWSKLKGYEWVWLLKKQPQFADKCDKWNEFEGNNWADLLSIQPQFADKCSENWSKLLNASPEMIANYNWSELGAMDWCNLLYVRPEFADNCNKWVEMFSTNDKRSFDKLLRKHPELIEKCHGDWENLSGYAMYEILIMAPQLIEKSAWSKIHPNLWAKLLLRHPDFAEKFNKWNELSAEDCFRLFSCQPQLSDKICLNQFSDKDLLLLSKNKKFIQKLNWANQPLFVLERLLPKFPEYVSAVPDDLLLQLSFKRPADYIKLIKVDVRVEKILPWERFSEDHWLKLLSERPHLAYHCVGRKLSPFCWARLVKCHPILALGCPWHEFTENAWKLLLKDCSQYQDIYERFSAR
ncbi:MAG: hypothetical protein IKB25_12875 [Lentisphaeria bacterium]|nr:hypothetical protein [Lentisphaeria bacterium]